MHRTRARWAVLAALALTLTGTARAQNTGQKVGGKLDEVGRDLKQGLNRAGNAAREQFSDARIAVQNMTVESRVYGRLHWDKALAGATIELTATDDGVVTLNGSVADARAKARAADLARETVGVTRVVDALAIRPAAATTTTAPRP